MSARPGRAPHLRSWEGRTNSGSWYSRDHPKSYSLVPSGALAERVISGGPGAATWALESVTPGTHFASLLEMSPTGSLIRPTASAGPAVRQEIPADAHGQGLGVELAKGINRRVMARARAAVGVWAGARWGAGLLLRPCVHVGPKLRLRRRVCRRASPLPQAKV